MAKWLIFSDLHFGDPLCSLRNEAVAKGLRVFLRGLGQVEELILAGDILGLSVRCHARYICRDRSRPPCPGCLDREQLSPGEGGVDGRGDRICMGRRWNRTIRIAGICLRVAREVLRS